MKRFNLLFICAFSLTFLFSLSGCGPKGDAPTAPSGVPLTKASTVPARFVDVAEESGLKYIWTIPGKRPLNILQTIGNGCAFLDYDNDGNLDILLVGTPLALYKGDGKGHFTDVTQQMGLDKLSGHFLGCAVGDVDGDGYDDIYISGYRTGLLLHNEQGRAFTDITAKSGLKPQPWGTSCAFYESVPGSGKLDLFICNYAVFGPDTDPQLCNEQGHMTSCGPRYYKPLKSALYRNLGGGKFVDISGSSGANQVSGKGLGVAIADFAEYGRPGIVIANDEMPGDVLKPTASTGEIRYKNEGGTSGPGYDRDGNVHGGMGVDFGDYDNDGKLDIFVATFMNEPKSLYHNDGKGLFSDRGHTTGIGTASTPFVTFGVKFLDYDNDGWLDVVIANGHVQDNIQEINPNMTFRQNSQIFHNTGSNPLLFEETTKTVGPDLGRPIVGRGLAVGDFDNDGKMDILIVDSDGKPLLLHNQGTDVGHWLGVKLTGTKSNRNGYGAVLTIEAGGRTLMRTARACGSYLSYSDQRVHLGIGKATQIDTLTVTWPGGTKSVYKNIPADGYITIKEGDKEIGKK